MTPFDRAYIYRARYRPPVFYANREQKLEHLSLLHASAIDSIEALPFAGTEKAIDNLCRFVAWAEKNGACAT